MTFRTVKYIRFWQSTFVLATLLTRLLHARILPSPSCRGRAAPSHKQETAGDPEWGDDGPGSDPERGDDGPGSDPERGDGGPGSDPERGDDGPGSDPERGG